MYKPKVYTASKIHHHLLWQKMKQDIDWDFIEWTASWVDHPDIPNEQSGEDILPTVFRDAWMANIADVRRSDFILLYSGGEEALRGALIEAGAGMAYGLNIVAVGVAESHSWTFHPQVVRMKTLREARDYLYRFTTMVPPNLRGRRRVEDDQEH